MHTSTKAPPLLELLPPPAYPFAPGNLVLCAGCYRNDSLLQDGPCCLMFRQRMLPSAACSLAPKAFALFPPILRLLLAPPAAQCWDSTGVAAGCSLGKSANRKQIMESSLQSIWERSVRLAEKFPSDVFNPSVNQTPNTTPVTLVLLRGSKTPQLLDLGRLGMGVCLFSGRFVKRSWSLHPSCSYVSLEAL